MELELAGEPPSPFEPPEGCAFHPRCPYRVKRCELDVPALRRLPDGDWVACHRAEELDLTIGKEVVLQTVRREASEDD
jgi:ABC-type antimicrobial peptide transport system ATPase subunit